VKSTFVLYEHLQKWNSIEKSPSTKLANFTSVYGARIIYNIQAHFPSSHANVIQRNLASTCKATVIWNTESNTEYTKYSVINAVRCMTLKLLNWYLHPTISSAHLIKKNILFNPVLWKPAHYGTAVNYAILYYLKRQIVRLPMAQKRRRKSVAMHNCSTAHFSVPCINDATKTLIGLRQHIL